MSRELYDRAAREAEVWRGLYAETIRPAPVPVVTEPMSVVREKPTPSIVASTIKDESGGDPRLAAYLRKRAADLRAEGKTPEEIAEQLSSWQTTETEGVT